MTNFKDTYRTLSVAICIALAVSVACTALMFFFGVRDDIYAPPSDQPTDAPEQFEPTLKETIDYGDIYLSHMVIFCDSTLSGIKNSNVLKDNSVIVTGKDGDMPLDFNCASVETDQSYNENKALSITDITTDQTPKYMLISIGLKNGVEHCSEEKFKQYYQKLIDTVSAASPSTNIILASILPTSKEVSKNTPAVSIDKIDRANEWIYELATSNSLRYLNVAEVFKDDKGYLSPEYDGGDGIHLNDNAYALYIEYVKTHGYK